jgi:hypothetical protein
MRRDDEQNSGSPGDGGSGSSDGDGVGDDVVGSPDEPMYSAVEVKRWYERGWERGFAEGQCSDGGGGVRRAVLLSDEARMLPAVLLGAYSRLWAAALRQPGSTVGPDTRGMYGRHRVKGPRTSTGQSEAMSGTGAKRAVNVSQGGVVKSERWLALKGRVDRKLRKVAREIMEEMQGGTGRLKTVRRCVGCKKYGESDWSWCPFDGKRMEEVE